MSEAAVLVVAALVCVLATLLLVVVEQAFANVSRGRVEELLAERQRGSSQLAKMLRARAKYVNGLLFARITTATFAVVLVTVIFSAAMTSPRWLGPVVAGIVMLIVGYVGFGVAAQTIGRQHAAGIALRWRGLASACHWVFGWLATAMIHVGNALTPGRGYRLGPFVTESELRELVDLAEADHVIAADERAMIHSIFELSGTMARNVMVPRTQMVSVASQTTLMGAMAVALQSGFSRLPVVGSSLDDVVGVLYLKDVARRMAEQPGSIDDEHVTTVMRPVLFVPDSKPADDLLRQMQAARVHLAVVVDEYGGTAGLVTIEDVLEEIVGDIADEYDKPEAPEIVQINSTSWRVDPKLDIDDLIELIGVDLDEDRGSADTVAGLLARRLGAVPSPGSRARIAGFRLTAEGEGEGRNQIGTVLIERIDMERIDVDEHIPGGEVK